MNTLQRIIRFLCLEVFDIETRLGLQYRTRKIYPKDGLNPEATFIVTKTHYLALQLNEYSEYIIGVKNNKSLKTVYTSFGKFNAFLIGRIRIYTDYKKEAGYTVNAVVSQGARHRHGNIIWNDPNYEELLKHDGYDNYRKNFNFTYLIDER